MASHNRSSEVETFQKPCRYLAKRKIFRCQGSSTAAIGNISVYFDDNIDVLKNKLFRFPFTVAADLIPDDKFEFKEEMIT